MMVNTGRPSAGCERCRKRRIKEVLIDDVDAHKDRVSHTPGIHDLGQFEIHNGSRSMQIKTSSWILYTGPDTEQSRKVILSKSQTPFLVRPDSFADLEFQSVCLFMKTFTLNPRPIGKLSGHLDFLPAMYRSTSDESCLRATVIAISKIMYTKRYHASDEIDRSVIKAYSTALTTTNRVLQDPQEFMQDSTLMAVWLLGLYELMTYRNPKLREDRGWAFHTKGTMQILKVRGHQGLANDVGRSIFQVVNLCILVNAALPNPALELDIRQIEMNLGYGAEIYGPELAVAWNCFTVATNTRAELKTLLSSVHIEHDEVELRNKIQLLIRAGRSCLEEYDLDIATINTPTCRPRRLIYALIAPQSIYTFSSLWLMGTWVSYWAARMSLMGTIVDSEKAIFQAQDWSGSHFPIVDRQPVVPMTESLRAAIQINAQQILGCIAFAFGAIDTEGVSIPTQNTYDGGVYTGSAVGALYMYWPLVVVKYNAYTSANQKDMAKAALQRIGAEIGLARALRHA